MRFPSIGDLAMNLFGAMSAIFTHTWYCSKVIAADQLTYALSALSLSIMVG